MLTGLEQAVLMHGVVVTMQAAPVKAPFDASLDAQPAPTAQTPFTTLAAPRGNMIEGLADVFHAVVTVSHDRKTVDGRTLGLTANFNFDQATVTLGGVAYQIVKTMPRYYGGAIAGWDLGLNR